jgi:sporulation delaying protein B
MKPLDALGARVHAWTQRTNPWTDVYGTVRTILALTSALTLLANPAHVLFRPGSGGIDFPRCEDAQALGLYCVAGASHLELARWLAILGFLLVASGWRPRVTGLLHFWLSFSLQANALVVEGGDQITSILTMLLLPVALTDPRKWHWSAPPERTSVEGRFLARTALATIRLQVAGIYFHAAVGKFAVEQWTDGTALYYWLLHPSFGAPDWLAPTLSAALANGFAVCAMTFGTLIVEFMLAAALIARRSLWPRLLVAGFVLHAGIIVMQGLMSFGLVMFGALILYLRPHERTFRWGDRIRVPTLALLRAPGLGRSALEDP